MNKGLVLLMIAVLALAGGYFIYTYTGTPDVDPLIDKLLEYPCIKNSTIDVTNDIGIKDPKKDVGYYFKNDRDKKVYIQYGKHQIYVNYTGIDIDLKNKLSKLKLSLTTKKDGTLLVKYGGGELEEWIEHK